jgi:hypothetical protein
VIKDINNIMNVTVYRPMIEVYKDHGRFQKRANELQKWVCEKYEKEKIYKQLINSFNLGVHLEPPDYIFVSDMFAEQYVGGAELSLQAIIDATPEDKNIAKINSAGLTKSVIDSNKDATWIFGNIAHMQDDVTRHIVASGMNYHFI